MLPEAIARQRRQIADSYRDESTERLIEILETRDYPPPMDPYIGDSSIVKELVRFRRHELSGSMKARLRPLATGRLIPSSAATLRRYLALLDGDAPQLIAEWHQEPWTDGSGFEYFDLLDCLGALRVEDPPIIDDLIRRIEERGMYKVDVMIALGRIGAAAGARAADAIRQHIPECHSPPFRERVLQRLSRCDEIWDPCPACRSGWTRTNDAARALIACPTCVGLMIVPEDVAASCATH